MDGGEPGVTPLTGRYLIRLTDRCLFRRMDSNHHRSASRAGELPLLHS